MERLESPPSSRPRLRLEDSLRWLAAAYDREILSAFQSVRRNSRISDGSIDERGDAFRAALGNDAVRTARLTPQLRRLFSDIPPPLELSLSSREGSSSTRLWNFGMEALQAVRSFCFRRPALGRRRTLSLLNHIARSISKVPVLILGTFRDNEIDSAGPLARTLDELLRIHMLERISSARPAAECCSGNDSCAQ